MSQATDRPARRVYSWGIGLGCGCLGFLLGLLIVGSASWIWFMAEEEVVRNPTLDLDLPAGPVSEAKQESIIDRLAADYLSSPENVGLVIATVHGESSRIHGYGSTSREKGKTPNGDTVFEIASVGKTFTGILLADMSLREELKLGDSLATYLPAGARVPKQPISLLDLATHSASLPSLPPNFDYKDPLNPYKDYTTEEMLIGLGQIEIVQRPGTHYEYSNLGFGLMGYALARRADQEFEQLAIARLLDPLKMTSTRITLNDDLKNRLATPHDGGTAVPVWEDLTMPGAGSFLSTANDLVLFLRAHWSDLDEDSGTLRRAMELAIQKQRPGGTASESVGLGWHISSENALDIVWHNGGSGGSNCYVAFLPQKQVGVIVLSNSTSSVDSIGRTILYLLDPARP